MRLLLRFLMWIAFAVTMQCEAQVYKRYNISEDVSLYITVTDGDSVMLVQMDTTRLKFDINEIPHSGYIRSNPRCVLITSIDPAIKNNTYYNRRVREEIPRVVRMYDKYNAMVFAFSRYPLTYDRMRTICAYLVPGMYNYNEVDNGDKVFIVVNTPQEPIVDVAYPLSEIKQTKYNLCLLKY